MSMRTMRVFNMVFIFVGEGWIVTLGGHGPAAYRVISCVECSTVDCMVYFRVVQSLFVF